MPNEFDQFDTPKADTPANEFDQFDARQPVDWNTAYAGLDGLNDRLNPEGKARFQTLDRFAQAAGQDPKEWRAQAINQAYVAERLPNRTDISQNWDAIRQAYAKTVMRMKEDKVSDTQLYNAISDAKKLSDGVEMAGAGVLPVPMRSILRYNAVTGHYGLSDQSLADLPEAPPMAHLPLGPMDPAFIGASYNVFAKTLNGLTTPTNLAITGATAGVGTLAIGGSKAAGVAMKGISGLFAGMFGKHVLESTAEAGPEWDNLTFQQKMEKVGDIATSSIFTLAGLFGVAAKYHPTVADVVKDKTPMEAADALHAEAEKTAIPEARDALHEAGNELQETAVPEAKGGGWTKDENGEWTALPEPKAEPVQEPIPEPVAAKDGEVLSVKDANVEAQREKLNLPPQEKPDVGGSFEKWDNEAKAMLRDDPEAGKKLVDELTKEPRPLGPTETALLNHERVRTSMALDAAAEKGDPAEMKLAQEAFDRATNASVNTLGAQGQVARKMGLNLDYSLAKTINDISVANGGKEIRPGTKLYETVQQLVKQQRETAERLNKLEQKRAQDAAIPRTSARPPSGVRVGIKDAANAARERLKKAYASGQVTSGLDPAVLRDHALVGVDILLDVGKDFGKWSAEMLKEFGDKIKPYLHDIYVRSLEERQRASRMQAMKTRLANETQALAERGAEGDLEKPKRPEPIEPDAELIKAREANKAVKDKIDQLKQEEADRNRSIWEKGMEQISGTARFAALSGYHTLEKLLGYTGGKLIETPINEAVSATLAKIPGLSKTFEKGQFEGKATLGSVARFYTSFATRGMKEAVKYMKDRTTTDRTLYGDGKARTPHWFDFFGQLHGAEKTPLLTGTMDMNVYKATQAALKAGATAEQMANPLVQGAIRKEAYDYSQQSILQEKNAFAEWYKQGMAKLKGKNPQTGKTSFPKQVVATAIETLLTKDIVRTPANYVMQTLKRTPFGLAEATREQIAVRRSIDKLTPQEADAMNKLLTTGLVGSAFFVWGMADAFKDPSERTFGGYYSPGDKRDPRDVGFGKFRPGGVELPHLLTHFPLLESAQMGNTFMRVLKGSLDPAQRKEGGLVRGMLTSIFGLAEQAPIASHAMRLAKIGNPREQTGFVADTLRGLIPQFIQNIAQDTDTDIKGKPIPRKPTTIEEGVKMGVPGLRQEVPRKPGVSMNSEINPNTGRIASADVTMPYKGQTRSAKISNLQRDPVTGRITGAEVALA